MACHTNCVIMSDYKNVSPSKKVRSLKRLFSFNQSKVSSPCKSKKNLSFSSQPATSFYPITPKLSITVLPSTAIPKIISKKPKLSFVRNQAISVMPQSSPDAETNGFLIAQLRNMKFVLEEIDLINDLVDYRQEQIQMLSKIIPQFEDILPT